MNFDMILEGTETPTSPSSMNIILYVFLGLLIVWLLVSPFLNAKRNKRYYEEREKVFAQFVPGTKVKTSSGLFGEIIDIRTAKDGTKVATIKSGEGSNALTFEIDVNYIAYVDDKDEEPVTDDMQDLMQKVEDTSKELDENLSTKVIDEKQNFNEEVSGDPFEKPKKSTKKNSKKNKEE